MTDQEEAVLEKDFCYTVLRRLDALEKAVTGLSEGNADRPSEAMTLLDRVQRSPVFLEATTKLQKVLSSAEMNAILDSLKAHIPWKTGASREVNLIIYHCTVTSPGWGPGLDADEAVKEIRRWHTDPPNNYNDIGYHGGFDRSGRYARARAWEKQGAHTLAGGGNRHSLGFFLCGGRGGSQNPRGDFFEHFTLHQLFGMLALHEVLAERGWKGLRAFGHNDFDRHRGCPLFDVKDLLGGERQVT